MVRQLINSVDSEIGNTFFIALQLNDSKTRIVCIVCTFFPDKNYVVYVVRKEKTPLLTLNKELPGQTFDKFRYHLILFC